MQFPASAADRSGFLLLTAAGVLAPIPNGSNAASATGLIGIALAICLLCAPFAPAPGARSRALLSTMLLLSGLLLAWAIAQTLLPITGEPDLGALAEAASSGSAPGGATSNLQPVQSVGYVLIPLAAFMSALIYIRDDEVYLSFLHILLGSSFVVTLLCIAEYLVSPGTRLLQPKQHYLESFTGTFVNPNTAATYFGVMLLLSLSLCMRQFRQVRRHQRMIRAAASNPRLRKFLVYCALTAVFAIALLLTRSRAGTLSAFTAVAVFIGSYAFAAAATRGDSWRLTYIGAAAAVAAVVGIFAFFAQRVVLRIRPRASSTPGACTYESTWRAIQDHIWLGTGLGSFQDVFPAYRTPECGLGGYWEMAHSVYLEGWLSLGILFIVILVVTYYQLLKTYAYGYRHRHRFRFVPLTSLSILVLLSLHSLVDFSLQIPGMAVVAALALGAGAAVSLAPRSDEGSSQAGRMASPP